MISIIAICYPELLSFWSLIYIEAEIIFDFIVLDFVIHIRSGLIEMTIE